MKYGIILMLALIAVGTARAEAIPESLLRCDSSFFSELYNQRATFKNIAPLATDKSNHAWFVPKDGSETIWFTHPIQSGQLTLSGYWQQRSDLEEMGKYYYWGLIFDEPPMAVMAALSNVNWQKAGDDYFTNPMIKKIGSQQWQANTGAASGIAPAKDSVEKLAILDVYNGKSRLLCSIQGNVTEVDLLPLRPDLKGEKQ